MGFMHPNFWGLVSIAIPMCILNCIPTCHAWPERSMVKPMESIRVCSSRATKNHEPTINLGLQSMVSYERLNQSWINKDPSCILG